MVRRTSAVWRPTSSRQNTRVTLQRLCRLCRTACHKSGAKPHRQSQESATSAGWSPSCSEALAAAKKAKELYKKARLRRGEAKALPHQASVLGMDTAVSRANLILTISAISANVLRRCRRWPRKPMFEEEDLLGRFAEEELQEEKLRQNLAQGLGPFHEFGRLLPVPRPRLRLPRLCRLGRKPTTFGGVGSDL
ncbi:unnamed protein product [Symbiodinium sp. CCMP2592]|nr:unnamed protein product [Symbiodinium sp. CCMP2592]